MVVQARGAFGTDGLLEVAEAWINRAVARLSSLLARVASLVWAPGSLGEFGLGPLFLGLRVQSLRLGVVRGAAPIDRDARFVTNGPGVMPWRDRN